MCHAAAVPPHALPAPLLELEPSLHCLVISLARAHARQQYVRGVLLPRACGMQCEILDATDGQALSADKWRMVAPVDAQHVLATRLERAKFIHFTQPLSAGEAGCALSHVHVLRETVRRRLAWAVVLEDDADLPSGFASRCRRAIAALPPTATTTASAAPLLYLGYGVTPAEAARDIEEARAAASSNGDGGDVTLVPVEYAWCCHAMAISYEAARRLLSGATPVDKPADHHCVLCSSVGAVQAYVAVPPLVTLSTHSPFGREHHQYRVAWTYMDHGLRSFALVSRLAKWPSRPGRPEIARARASRGGNEFGDNRFPAD